MYINKISQINFESSAKQKQTKDCKSLYFGAGALSSAAVIVTSMVLGKKTKGNLAEILKKNGISIKDGFATVISTGERYSGKIEHNVKWFGLKKECLVYDNGELVEKLYHNKNGRELEGYFFKNNVLRIKVNQYKTNGNKKYYPYYIYDKNGKLESVNDCFGVETKSVFEDMRTILKGLK